MKDLGNGAELLGFDGGIEIDEVPAEVIGKGVSDGGLAGTHKAGQENSRHSLQFIHHRQDKYACVPKTQIAWTRGKRNNSIMSRLLPLFPLQLVVFPASAVPLHIFEDRYKEMVGAAEASGSEFGIVLAKDGGIVNSGCTVVVEQVLQRYPDGRFDVMTRGQRRFSILSIDEEKPYLQGEVEYFGDEDVTPPGGRKCGPARWDAFEKMRATLQAGGAEIKGEVPEANDPFLSFQLAQTVDDLDFQNLIQRTRSESERLRQFAEFMERYVPQRKYVAKMKRAAPTNGFGHKPASM